jgi:Putative MetA-pathway of phenol degradation
MKVFFTCLVIFSFFLTDLIGQEDKTPKKGSYLYFGQPSIEDNSMFIEEAFNQETGVIQHISNLIYDDGSWVYSYTQEIPLDDYRHQLSFTIPYSWLERPTELIVPGNDQFLNSGLGDLLINYRPLLWGKNDWALVIPRFTLILPTGNSQYGLGGGAWGGQFNLAVTKRISKGITMHYNAGITHFQKADYFSFDQNTGTFQQTYQRDLTMKNLGASAIWMLKPKFNFMLEYVSNFEKEINEDGSLSDRHAMVINPGFRFAVDIGKVQIVPGAGVPFNFEGGNFINTGAFIYLSIEPNYSK